MHDPPRDASNDHGHLTGCSPRDALAPLGPLACGGRVLSADHAPQLRRLRLRGVSAPPARAPSLAGRAPTLRIAVRGRLLPSRPQFLRRAGAPVLSAGVSRDRGLPPRWRANGALVLPGRAEGLDVSCRAEAGPGASARCESGSGRNATTSQRSARFGRAPRPPWSGAPHANARDAQGPRLRYARASGRGASYPPPPPVPTFFDARSASRSWASLARCRISFARAAFSRRRSRQRASQPALGCFCSPIGGPPFLGRTRSYAPSPPSGGIRNATAPTFTRISWRAPWRCR